MGRDGDDNGVVGDRISRIQVQYIDKYDDNDHNNHIICTTDVSEL